MAVGGHHMVTAMIRIRFFIHALSDRARGGQTTLAAASAVKLMIDEKQFHLHLVSMTSDE